jgi:hypothetical protein
LTTERRRVAEDSLRSTTNTARFDRATNHLCSANSSTPALSQTVRAEKWTLQEPAHICLRSGEQHIPPTLEHAYLVCSSPEKLAALRVLDKLWRNHPKQETPKGFNLPIRVVL